MPDNILDELNLSMHQYGNHDCLACCDEPTYCYCNEGINVVHIEEQDDFEIGDGGPCPKEYSGYMHQCDGCGRAYFVEKINCDRVWEKKGTVIK